MTVSSKEIAVIEANKFYSKYRQEWDDERIELMKEEKKVDFFLAMATSFFFTSWVLVALRAFEIWE